SYLQARSPPSYSSLHPTPTPALYTLSLHDALPISVAAPVASTNTTDQKPANTKSTSSISMSSKAANNTPASKPAAKSKAPAKARSEEHTSELQSRENLVCRLLLEKKKKNKKKPNRT